MKTADSILHMMKKLSLLLLSEFQPNYFAGILSFIIHDNLIYKLNDLMFDLTNDSYTMEFKRITNGYKVIIHRLPTKFKIDINNIDFNTGFFKEPI